MEKLGQNPEKDTRSRHVTVKVRGHLVSAVVSTMFSHQGTLPTSPTRFKMGVNVWLISFRCHARMVGGFTDGGESKSVNCQATICGGAVSVSVTTAELAELTHPKPRPTHSLRAGENKISDK